MTLGKLLRALYKFPAHSLLRELASDATRGELVHTKLEKRAPDELSPKPDPHEFRAPTEL